MQLRVQLFGDYVTIKDTENRKMATSLPLDTGGYDAAAFDRGTSPIIQMLTPGQARQLMEYRGDERLRQRIEELAAKSNEGLLTPAEKSEYEGYVRANKFVAILQAQAQKFLDSTQAG
jgi:uncharacterized protein YnzC (UPF0291/DUF896 family)